MASPLLVEQAFPLARLLGSGRFTDPQTAARSPGIIITASPANDAVVPLTALGAGVTVRSLALASARSLAAFRHRLPQVVELAPDEIVTGIFPSRRRHQTHPGARLSLGLRCAQAISVLSVAVVVERAAVGRMR